MAIIVENIRRAVKDLNLCGEPVCLHSSLRSFGWVEGGALTIVNGFLAEGCTVLVPTFSSDFLAFPPSGMRPERNGWDYEKLQGPFSGTEHAYTPQTEEIDRGMGVITAWILSLPDRVRGKHPLCSFSAVGAQANELILCQEPLDAFTPLNQLAEKGGSVILMGVNLCSLTIIHLAEKMAGRALFRRWANGPNGKVMEVEAGGCSAGFNKFEPVLSPLMKQRRVGESMWHILPAKRTLEVAAKAIGEKSTITHCGKPECERCNDAALGGPMGGETTIC